jgi:Integrase core domain
MEEHDYVDRLALRQLMQAHPDWKQGDFVRATHRSVTWVKKWRKRLRDADPEDQAVLWGQSRARKTPPTAVPPKVVERILAIRDHPPQDLKRVPGPKAIVYYLQHDAVYGAFADALPRSTKKIWQILKANGRIAAKKAREHAPVQRPEPLREWQLDFKDVSSVAADPEGKQMHVVETLNIVDAGTSILVDGLVREDYNAETALQAVVEVLATYGLPQVMTFDRDPRWVGSSTSRDFPSPFTRFCHCLGIIPNVCPPRQPEKNPFVERYNGTYRRECLAYYRPRNLEEAQTVTQAFKQHYNTQRPNQALTCRNQPPAVAFPVLPSLPRLPEQVDPDAWLKAIDGQTYVRKIRRDGFVSVDDRAYYIKQKLSGQYVMVRVDATQRQFSVYAQGHWLKDVPIKGLYGKALPFADYLTAIAQEARVDWRKTQAQRALNRRRTRYAHALG